MSWMNLMIFFIMSFIIVFCFVYMNDGIFEDMDVLFIMKIGFCFVELEIYGEINFKLLIRSDGFLR